MIVTLCMVPNGWVIFHRFLVAIFGGKIREAQVSAIPTRVAELVVSVLFTHPF